MLFNHSIKERSNMLTVLVELSKESLLVAGGSVITASIVIYVVYQRCLHRLAKYPGPFLASLTDLWQAHQFFTLQQPYNLTKLHEKYGPVVRYGPDKLSVTYESAIPIIYQKSARSMPKTEFYDAYGAAHPNVFGMRDETVSRTWPEIYSESNSFFSPVALNKTASYVTQFLPELYQRDGEVHGS